MSIYAFQRKEGFYFLELGSDDEAIANGKCNPGTLRVVNEVAGYTVYIPDLKCWACGNTNLRPTSIGHKCITCNEYTGDDGDNIPDDQP